MQLARVLMARSRDRRAGEPSTRVRTAEASVVSAANHSAPAIASGAAAAGSRASGLRPARAVSAEICLALRVVGHIVSA